MTDPSVAEEAVVGFNYSAAAELFPTPNWKSRRQQYRRSEHISKSTRRDTTAREFVACTKAWTIPWSVSGRLSAMTTRSHNKSGVFSHSFELKGVDRALAARRISDRDG